jgi:ornithine carbamoyltransferase
MTLNTPLHHRSLWSLDGLTGRDLASLLDTARSLKAAELAGHPQQPLRGKNIAVMTEAAEGPALQGFTAAATALGARVAHIRPSVSQETAQLLGRLYDAIECEGLPGDALRDIDRSAGRPVFNGLGEPSHPLRVLGDLMTLREHSSKPMKDITVSFRGDTSSPDAQAWRQSAALAGFSLRMDGPAPAGECADFIWDEMRNHRCADGRVELACGCNAAHVPLGIEQMANQRYALQAVLCSAVA